MYLSTFKDRAYPDSESLSAIFTPTFLVFSLAGSSFTTAVRATKTVKPSTAFELIYGSPLVGELREERKGTDCAVVILHRHVAPLSASMSSFCMRSST